ncbi:MAG TPA: alpha/beta hydrolase [Xanthomonadales bacterium]|nr:alpha/beta hydrolase [Xanthomonadales bacterium]
MKKALLKLLLFAVAVYCFYAWQMWRVQRGILFPGTTLKAQALPAGAQRVALRASFGRVDVAWLPPGPAADGRAIVYLHGNYETIGSAARDVAPLHALGPGVALVEFPGYGGAPGAPTLESLREASTLAYDWVARQPGVRADAITVMGRSIGGGPASLLAVDRPARALLLLSTFSDLESFAHGRLLPAALIKDRYDNAARLRELRAPVLVVHGRRDELIPFAQSSILSHAARDAPVVALDCGHNDCRYFAGESLARIRAFLAAAPPR